MARWLIAISIFMFDLARADEFTSLGQNRAEQALSAQAITWEAQRWGDIYIQLIQNTLKDQSQYTGEICRVNIRLHPSGFVRRVTTLPPPYNSKTPKNDLLCNEVFLAVYRVKQFPMPTQSNVKQKVQNINLTISTF